MLRVIVNVACRLNRQKKCVSSNNTLYTCYALLAPPALTQLEQPVDKSERK